jgi:hypothetical protein
MLCTCTVFVGKYLFNKAEALFGPMRDEVTGGCRKLHNVELNDLYCSPNIVRVIRSRKMW